MLQLFLYLILTSLTLSAFEIEKLTLEEKVGQLLIVHFKGADVNLEINSLFKKCHIGGCILYTWANELKNPKQVQQLNLSLQKMNEQLGSSIPLLIGIDQEGGRVNRLKEGFTTFPSQKILSSTEVPELGKLVAQAIARELKTVGININFAPVVDINSNPLNPIIGDRALGVSPEKVTRWSREILDGYQQADFACSFKHFPGHGGVTQDSHRATPTVLKSLNELYENELYPYHSISPLPPAILTAHIILPELDKHNPATFSEAILTHLLRNKLHFDGVIISDSLVMKGLSNYANSYEEAAFKAFEAGCDLICLGGKLLNEDSQDEIGSTDILRIHAFLVDAFKNNKLSIEKLNQSVDRILKLKRDYKFNEWKQLIVLSEGTDVSDLSHQQLKQEILLLSSMKEALTTDIQLELGQKIWENECGKKIDNLIFWSPYEEVLSLGIGHFIWYPDVINKKFDEGFVHYIAFLDEHSYPYPQWIKQSSHSPWQTRDLFLENRNDSRLIELKSWLMDTFDLQSAYIVQQAINTTHQIIHSTPLHQRGEIIEKVAALVKTPTGLFALIDYINFKGSGLCPSERYENQGWGLYQVLSEMEMTNHPLESFKTAAIQILEKRIKLAPISKNEAHWIQGWKNRIYKY